jgi:hypothetical protein
MAYLTTSLLRDVQLTLGFSFGLLAVFTIMRFRSTNIPVREMTYLYLSDHAALCQRPLRRHARPPSATCCCINAALAGLPDRGP